MNKLSELAKLLEINTPQLDTEVLSVVTDASKATKGSAFVAIRGLKNDGHDFIQQAIKNGASALIVESLESAPEGFPTLVVLNSRRALSFLAAKLADYPTEQIKLIGVTGTSGKSTTVSLIYHVLQKLNLKTLRLGTLGYLDSLGNQDPDTLTTPDPVYLNRLFSQARERGIEAAVIEVSSHALDQHRVSDLSFDVGVFLNLSRDHLDYHPTMQDYFEAKCRLVNLLKQSKKTKPAFAVNLDNQWGQKLYEQVKNSGVNVITFGREPSSDIRLNSSKELPTSTELEILFAGVNTNFTVPLIGAHNLENVLAACAALVGLGFKIKEVSDALQTLPQVPGRLERIYLAESSPSLPLPRVFVDYAHKPDALESVLQTLRSSTNGKLWLVFGCGGDRDRGKRPQMGEIAAKLADLVVVTSDNPRSEDPDQIISEIVKGTAIEARLLAETAFVEADRRSAIKFAIERARPEDTVLVAGKGHENYQIIGSTKMHFSDQEEVREGLLGLR